MLDYYLWIPFLPTFYFGFTKFTRLLWRYFLEKSPIKNIMGGDTLSITFYFGFCKLLYMLPGPALLTSQVSLQWSRRS